MGAGKCSGRPSQAGAAGIARSAKLGAVAVVAFTAQAGASDLVLVPGSGGYERYSAGAALVAFSVGPAKPAHDGEGRVTRARPRAEILELVDATAVRHAGAVGVRAAGMSAREWADLFRANIEIESGFNPKARSPVGAYGLGQLMPETARALGVDRYDIAQNLEGSARYLVAMLERFGSAELALAAYNAGPEAVERHGGIPPYRETMNHVRKVMSIAR